MSHVSPPAATAAAEALAPHVGDRASALVAFAMQAAHDPALGLDRSVCLRDVVEALRGMPGSYRDVSRSAAGHWGSAAGHLEREFTS